ncbi:MAG TPA: hypothetical protein VE224_18045 [Pseudolabrys sp.]|nr:hypothetical protein [Pseudolabrys sp.]
MKTLTALTVAAALAAGMSVAGAATPMQKTGGYNVTGHSAFCTKTRTGKELNCKFASRASCEKIAKPGNKTCMANPKMATGSGMMKHSSKMKK